MKTKPLSQQNGVPSQSPNLALTSVDLEVDLAVHSFSHSQIKVSQPFAIEFQLTLAGLLPAPGRKRLMQLVVQYVTPMTTSSNIEPSHNTPLSSPRVSIDSQTKPFTTRLQEVDSQSPIRKSLNSALIESPDSTHSTLRGGSGLCFPSPLYSASTSSCLIPLGSNVIWLPQFELFHEWDDTKGTEIEINSKLTVKTQFRYQFIATQRGFSTIGGLRLLSVEDRIVKDDNPDGMLPLLPQERNAAKVIKEWDVISDIWITS